MMRSLNVQVILVLTASILAASWAKADSCIDPGPGFDVSGYIVNASANLSSLNACQINSTPGSQVSASVTFNPFLKSSASAGNLQLSAMVLTGVSGGTGEVGAGAGSESLYELSGLPPNTPVDLSFVFDATGTLLAVPGGVGTQVAAFDFGTNITVGSIPGTVDAIGTGDISGAPGSLAFTNNTGFTMTPDPNLANVYDLTEQITVNVEAEDFVVVDPTISLQAEVLNAEAQATLGLSLASVTVTNPGLGIPEFSGVPTIQVTPEPATWSITLTGLLAFGLIRRWRSSGKA